MCVLVKICAIFFLITPCIVGQNTGSGSYTFSTENTQTYTGSSTFSTENTETSTVSLPEETDITHSGSSTFSTENTEASTVSSSEETYPTNTGPFTFSTENTETSTVSSSEETDTTSTGSSNFITENTETSSVRSSEETDTIITGSSTFTADNSKTSALTFSEETDTTVEDGEYLTNYVFPITPVREYLRQRFFRSTSNTDLETSSTSDTTTPDSTTEFTSTTISTASSSEDTTTPEFTSTTISTASSSEDTTTPEFTSTTISTASSSEDTTTPDTTTEYTSTTISTASSSEDTTTPDSTSEYTSTPVSSTTWFCEDSINADNLTINIKPSNTSFDVSWDLPNSECFTYNITLNDKTYSTTSLFIHIDGLVPCTLYEVIVEVYYNNDSKGSRSEDESTLPATDEHAQVKDLDITPESSALHVIWKKPYNCDKYTYQISWGAGTDESLNDNHYIIKYLDPCTVYNVTVATVLDKSITAQVSKLQSTSTTIPGPVDGLNIDDINKDYINITWSEPIQTKNCVNNYRYEIQHNGNTVIKSLTKDTYLVIYNPDTCVEHIYIVSAEGSIGVSDSRSKSYDKVKVNNPPKNASNEFKENLLITKWTIGENECNPDKFYVSCSNPPEQSDIIEEGFKSQDMFIAHFYDLLPYTKYNCCAMFENTKGNSSCEFASIQTEAKEPNSPSNLIVTVRKPNIFDIRWDKPSSWNGEPEQYNITIEYLQSTYDVPDGCTVPTDKFSTLNNFSDTFVQTDPLEYSAKYRISVSAKSSGGWGTVTEKNNTTLSGTPEPVRGLKCFLKFNRDYNYEANVTATWKSPCKSNGPLRYFDVQLCKHREDTSDDKICVNYNSNVTNMSEYERVFNSLEAEYNYELTISVHNHEYESNPETCSFATPAGVPKKPTGENIFKIKEYNTTAEIYINGDMFSSDMGVIRHYAIIVAEKDCEEDPKDGLFDPKNWPVISSNCYFQDKVKAYQATPNYWNPFINKNVQNETFTLGKDLSCGNTNVRCNRPLTPNTTYTVKIRGFTEYGYSDTTFVSFSTVAESPDDSGVDVGLIVGIIIGILAIAFLIAGALFYKNGRIFIKNWPRMDSESQISPTPPPVSIKKFDSHYRKMSENSGKIKSEFQLLSTISSDVTLSTKKASLPDNKKKNRYVNILPYDDTRVILNITNSSSSDYINASYIQGYSGNSEYIAAQGPTEATCPAFWQMILEQNVRVIVMLTQCVENGKDKCYKYFPTVVEEYDLNNDIKIECIEEQLFTVYNRRTFKVVKNNVAKKIIHLQFNLWPDFDVPNDVSKMIEFYETVKEINMKKPSLILVHCSAGVGRTGTLIAIDILTQNIRDKRKVDIFGTVLNLRKQRMTMVQSERQYEFLFKCVHYIITKNGNMSNDRISESHM